MGSLAGHLLPGTFFLIFSVWWSFVTAIRYIQSKHLSSSKKSKSYETSSTMPCICLPSKRLRRAPTESYIKFIAGLIGILGEFVTAIEFNHKVKPGIGKDDVSIFGCENQSSHGHSHGHKRDVHEQIQSFYFARNNIQHITMYSGFVLQAFVEILLYKGYNLPKRSDFYFGLIAYLIEAFLFAFHLHSRAPMDIHLHILLVYAIIGCCLSICFEIYNPKQVMFTYARILFTMLQGTWFWQTGFVLYPPLDVDFLKWNRCDHIQIMTITNLFCLHVLLISIALLIQLCLLDRYYCSSKRARDKFDELIVIQKEWENKYDQLQIKENGLGDTKFRLLETDEDEVFDKTNSSPVSSTTSGNYSIKSFENNTSYV